AVALIVTVAVELVSPPVTLVGLNAKDERTGGVTVSVACAETVNEGGMTSCAVAVTFTLVAVDVGGGLPELKTTLTGTVAADELADRVTVRCAVFPAAGPFNVTVPVELADPP